MKSLPPKVKELLDESRELSHGDLAQFNWHLQLVVEHSTAERTLEGLKKPTVKVFGGRNKAEHCARMRLSTAVLEQKSATEELESVYREWENLEKDEPIYGDSFKKKRLKISLDNDDKQGIIETSPRRVFDLSNE